MTGPRPRNRRRTGLARKRRGHRRAAGDARSGPWNRSDRAQLWRTRCVSHGCSVRVAGQADKVWLRDHRDRAEEREGGGALVHRAHRAKGEGAHQGAARARQRPRHARPRRPGRRRAGRRRPASAPRARPSARSPRARSCARTSSDAGGRHDGAWRRRRREAARAGASRVDVGHGEAERLFGRVREGFWDASRPTSGAG